MSEARKRRVVPVVLLLLGLGALGLFLLKRNRGGDSAANGTSAGEKAARAARPWEFGDDLSLPTGAIEGVVRAADGAPLDGASVFLTRARPRGVPVYEAPKPMSVQTSAGGGRFRFDKVPPGDYGVAAAMLGHTPGNRTPLTLEPRGTLKVEVKLGRGGVVLSGRILDDAGGAVPGARVTAVEISNAFAGDQRAVPRVFQVVAANDGQYKLPLGPSAYGVTAEADGYARGNAYIRITRDLTKDIKLTPAARIVGKVLEGPEKKPVAEALVSLQSVSRNGGMWRQALTDESGTFTFKDLQAGTFQVAARRGRGVGSGVVVSVGAAQTTDGVVVTLSPASVIKGRVVTADGKPLGDALVQAEREDPPFESAVMGKAAADGTFALEGILPGRYSVRGEADGFARERKTVEVKRADVSGVELKLGAEAVIAGKVLDAAGKPVEGAKVQAYIEQGGGPRGRSTSRGATSGADGAFEIKRITVGKVTLSAEHNEAGLTRQELPSLAPGEKKEVMLKMAPGASIAGTVRYDDGSPATGVEVMGYPRMMGPGPMMTDAADTTDTEGRFRLHPLPKATIMVGVRDAGGFMSFGGPDDPSRKNVAIEDGEQKTGVDLVIKRRDRAISGIVVDPSGQPLGGATVMANAQRPEEVEPRKVQFTQLRVTTMDDGSFKLEELATGTYYLWATHPSFADGDAKNVAAGTSGAKIQMTMPSSLSGVVVSGGAPVPTYQITLMPGPKPNETEDQKRRRQMSGAFEAPSLRVHEASGVFAFSGLEAGTYELKVQTADGQVGTQPVELKAGEKKDGVRVVMEAGATLTGRIVDLETGQPLAGAMVFARAEGHDLRETADEQGAFTMRGVPPGTVRVNVSPNGRGHIGEYKEIEVAKGTQTVEAGVFKLMKGNYEDKMGPDMRPATIGMQVVPDPATGKPTVRNTAPDSAAGKAGIKKGDVIFAVDGKDVTGLGSGAVSYLLMGKAGTSVQVSVGSPGAEPKTLTIVREAPKPRPPGQATASGQPAAGQPPAGQAQAARVPPPAPAQPAPAR